MLLVKENKSEYFRRLNLKYCLYDDRQHHITTCLHSYCFWFCFVRNYRVTLNLLYCSGRLSRSVLFCLYPPRLLWLQTVTKLSFPVYMVFNTGLHCVWQTHILPTEPSNSRCPSVFNLFGYILHEKLHSIIWLSPSECSSEAVGQHHGLSIFFFSWHAFTMTVSVSILSVPSATLLG